MTLTLVKRTKTLYILCETHLLSRHKQIVQSKIWYLNIKISCDLVGVIVIFSLFYKLKEIWFISCTAFKKTANYFQGLLYHYVEHIQPTVDNIHPILWYVLCCQVLLTLIDNLITSIKIQVYDASQSIVNCICYSSTFFVRLAR